MTIAKTWKEGGHLKRETEDQQQVPRGEGSWTTALPQRILIKTLKLCRLAGEDQLGSNALRDQKNHF